MVKCIPPDDSSVYKNVNSSLFEFDFFEFLNNEIRKYNDLGDVYLLGDLNSRTGELPDFVPNINLDRYVDMPLDVIPIDPPLRYNMDKTVNSFDMKLLSLCKECNIHIANGRCESGNCTFHSIYRNKPTCSTVDYVITNCNNISYIIDMCVLDMTELSDHCTIIFSLRCNIDSSKSNAQTRVCE